MAQSSRTRRPLPAVFASLLLLALPLPSAVAQTRYRVTRDEPFRQEPEAKAKELATIPEGIVLTGGAPKDGWVEVSLDGYVWASSVGRTARDGHNLAVSSRGGENLRVQPNGPVMARLLSGFLLDEVSREGAWVRAKRAGWMPMAVLVDVASSPLAPEAPLAVSDTTPPPPVDRMSLDRAVTTRATPLARTPDSEQQGTLAPDTPVRIVGRNGEWVRVQTEGWVKESDLRVGSAGVAVGVTGAEVRTRPQDFENRLVQWTLQFLAINRADELRPEIPAGRPYMLARGPLPEANFVYVSLDAQQVREAERLQPLAQITTIVRIRVPKTKYLGNPVVDLIEMRVKAP